MSHLLIEGRRVLYDAEDTNLVSSYRWYLLTTAPGKVYAVAMLSNAQRINCGILYLHRAVMNASRSERIDHKNANTLDCRKSNLRKCNQSQNMANCLPRKGSKYKGVSLFKQTGCWHAYIKVNYKRKHLGYFSTAKEAALAYNKAAAIEFGEFARLNVIDDED